MRVSTVFAGLAAFAGSGLASSTSTATAKNAAPVQQINDGQIQNPVSVPPSNSTVALPPIACTPTPPPKVSPASPSPAPPPSYKNRTAVITQAYQPSTPVIPSITTSRPLVVQTNAGSTMVSSAVGLGFAAVVAALLG